MRPIARLALLGAIAATALGCVPDPTPSRSSLANARSPQIRESELQSDILELSDPNKYEGRETGTPKEKLAASYIAQQFRLAGLEAGVAPCGGGRDYLQPFEVVFGVGVAAADESNRLEFDDTPLSVRKREWYPLGVLDEVDIEGQVVFAKHGLVAPGTHELEPVDDYAGVDVRDKWLLVRDGIPEGFDDAHALFLRRYSSIAYKAQRARMRGAIGLLVVFDADRDLELESRAVPDMKDLGIRAIGLSLETGQLALEMGGYPGEEVALATLWTRPAAPLELNVSADLHTRKDVRTAHNVVGVLCAPPIAAPTPDPRDRYPIVVGAHYDHLGEGYFPLKSSDDDHQGLVHPGADDNASGVAGVIELAHFLQAAVAKASVTLRRDIVFAAWTGEELRYNGSKEFLRRVPNVGAYLNLDMIGRLRPGRHLAVWGATTSPSWASLVPSANSKLSVPLSICCNRDPYESSDNLIFFLAKIPSIGAHTGLHRQYHTADDVEGLIRYGPLARITELWANLLVDLATAEEAPQFQPCDGRGSCTDTFDCSVARPQPQQCRATP